MATKQLKFTPIKLNNDGNKRGTKSANDLVETLTENWNQMRKSYNEKDAGEKEEMLDFFNSAIDNLGEILFGDDSESAELADFVNSLDDGKCDIFVTTVNDGCIIEG